MAKASNNSEEPSGEHEPLLEHVGARIRAARRRAKLKQSEVAAAIGSGQSYIVDIEAGKANLTLKMLARIAAVLGVSPAALLLEGTLASMVDRGVFDEVEAGRERSMLFDKLEADRVAADRERAVLSDKVETDRERFVRIANLLRAVMSELARSTDALEKAHALSVEPAVDRPGEGPN